MSHIKPVNGILWDDGTIGNCVWGGVFLRDVLAHAGVEAQVGHHVCFASHATLCEDDTYYGASMPLSKAMDADEDVLLAYEVWILPLVISRLTSP